MKQSKKNKAHTTTKKGTDHRFQQYQKYQVFLVIFSFFLIPLVIVSTLKPTSTKQQAATSTIPPFQHVFLIIFENKDYSQIIGNASAPYINQLANQYALATNYTALMHPSLPNYIILNAGGNQGVTSDCPASQCGSIASDNFPHQLEAAGKTWKAYMEDMTSNCQTTDSGQYAQKHNPFAYFSTLSSTCATNDVPYTQFASDLSSGNVANYSWITPNLINDMHDGTIQDGDTWLSSNLPAILNSNAYKQNGLVIITFDEDSNSGGNNQVATIILSPLAKQGYKSTVAYDHNSLLRTLEDSFGLSPLGSAASASPMADFFNTTSVSQAPSVSNAPTGSQSPTLLPTWYCGGSQNCVTGSPTAPVTTGVIPSVSTVPPSIILSPPPFQIPAPSRPTTNPGSNNNNAGGLQEIINLLVNLLMQLLNFFLSLFNAGHQKN